METHIVSFFLPQQSRRFGPKSQKPKKMPRMGRRKRDSGTRVLRSATKKPRSGETLEVESEASQNEDELTPEVRSMYEFAMQQKEGLDLASAGMLTFIQDSNGRNHTFIDGKSAQPDPHLFAVLAEAEYEARTDEKGGQGGGAEEGEDENDDEKKKTAARVTGASIINEAVVNMTSDEVETLMAQVDTAHVETGERVGSAAADTDDATAYVSSPKEDGYLNKADMEQEVAVRTDADAGVDVEAYALESQESYVIASQREGLLAGAALNTGTLALSLQSRLAKHPEQDVSSNAAGGIDFDSLQHEQVATLQGAGLEAEIGTPNHLSDSLSVTPPDATDRPVVVDKPKPVSNPEPEPNPDSAITSDEQTVSRDTPASDPTPTPALQAAWATSVIQSPQDPLLLSQWPPQMRQRISLGQFRDPSAPTSIPAPADFAHPDGAVVYWVQGCVRVQDNSGLDFARWLATRRAVPLITVCSVDARTYADVMEFDVDAASNSSNDFGTAEAYAQVMSVGDLYRRKSWLRLRELCSCRTALEGTGISLIGLVLPSDDTGMSEATAVGKHLSEMAGQSGGLLAVVTDHSFHPGRDAVTLELSSVIPGTAVVAVDSLSLSEWTSSIIDSCDVSRTSSQYPGRGSPQRRAPPPMQEWSFLLPRIINEVECTLMMALKALQPPPPAPASAVIDAPIGGAAEDRFDWEKLSQALAASEGHVFTTRASTHGVVGNGAPHHHWSEPDAHAWFTTFTQQLRAKQLAPAEVREGLDWLTSFLRAGLLSSRRAAIATISPSGDGDVLVPLLDRVRDIEVARVLVASAARNHHICTPVPVPIVHANGKENCNDIANVVVSSSSSNSSNNNNDKNSNKNNSSSGDGKALGHPTLDVEWLKVIPAPLLRSIDDAARSSRPAACHTTPVLLPLQFHLGRTQDVVFNNIQKRLVHTGVEPSGQALEYWLTFLLSTYPSTEAALHFALLELAKHSYFDAERCPLLAANLLASLASLGRRLESGVPWKAIGSALFTEISDSPEI